MFFIYNLRNNRSFSRPQFPRAKQEYLQLIIDKNSAYLSSWHDYIHMDTHICTHVHTHTFKSCVAILLQEISSCKSDPEYHNLIDIFSKLHTTFLTTNEVAVLARILRKRSPRKRDHESSLLATSTWLSIMRRWSGVKWCSGKRCSWCWCCISDSCALDFPHFMCITTP